MRIIKITDIKIEKLSAELEKPFKVAFGMISSADTWIVKVTTDEGICGFGSAAPTPFLTGDTMETCYIAMKMIAEALIGADPMDIAGAHRIMEGVIHYNGPAKCAFDVALYDIMGKKLGMPVYKLLGGSDPVIENDATIGIDTTERVVARAQQLIGMGIRILKIKVGLDIEHDIDMLRHVRAAAGSDVRLRVDANQGYDIETALKALCAFEGCGVDAAEQCLPWWDLEGSAELMRRNDTKVKLMLDESIQNVYDAERAARLGATHYMNIKLMKCGGLYDAVRIADAAEAAGIGCMVGCLSEDRISLAAGMSLVAAKRAVVEADCDSLLFLKEEPASVRGGFTNVGGIYTLSDRPGLGVEVDM